MSSSPLTRSLRRQLLCWLLGPILVLWLIGSTVTYGLAITFATDAYDQSLLDSVHTIASRVVYKDNRIKVDLPPVALDILKDNIRDRLFYQVLSGDGKTIAGDDQIPAEAFGKRKEKNPETPEFLYTRYNGVELRVASVYYLVPGLSGERVKIQVAQTMHGREKLADDILIGVVLPQLFIVVLSGLVVWFGVRRGLAPLNSIRDEVASRTPLDLSPLAESGVPKEVIPLVRAINSFMEKLKSDMESQRRFVANAAHQLRTPVAGMKTQSELALRLKEKDEIFHALKLILLGAERASRLTNQLLTLAKTETGLVDKSCFRPMNLNLTVMAVAKEMAALARSNDIDLTVNLHDEEALILAEPVSMQEIVVNLLENAIRYTGLGGRVLLRVDKAVPPENYLWQEIELIEPRDSSDSREARDARVAKDLKEAKEAKEAKNIRDAKDSRVSREVREASDTRDSRDSRTSRLSNQNREFFCLSVIDNGPGIPESERTKIFERFYRLSGSARPESAKPDFGRSNSGLADSVKPGKVGAESITGSGLGLSIVKEIARGHDALVVLDGGLDGRGSCFSVYFPCFSPSNMGRQLDYVSMRQVENTLESGALLASASDKSR